MPNNVLIIADDLNLGLHEDVLDSLGEVFKPKILNGSNSLHQLFPD